MQVFGEGKPWPNRAGSNENFVEDLADDLAHRIIESHLRRQLRGMARRVDLPDAVVVGNDAVTVGLTDPTRTLRERTGRHDRTEAVNVVDHLEGWATNSDGKPYAVLLGDSGSGKTTAAKVLNNRLNAAYRENLESSDTNNPAARLSIYLDLRKADLDERESPELNRLIDNVMERTWEVEAARTITAKVILDQVRNQGAVLIFDGLDEVLVRINEKRGREFVQQLWRALPPDLARDPNRNSGRLLMTCRTHYFPTIDSERSFFGGEDRAAGVSTLYEALHLLPFTEAQIRDYLSQYLGQGIDRCAGLNEVDSAMIMLAEVHNLLELAGRPYNLRLISQQLGALETHRTNGTSVSLAILYDGFIRDWLSRDDTKHVLRPDDKRTLMEDLAGRLWRESSRSISHKELTNWLMTRLTEDTDLGRWFTLERPDVETVVEDLRTATFVVRPGADRFEFAHTSLLEFFLASYLVRALIERQPDAWAMHAPSEETLVFVRDLLAGLATDPDRFDDADAAKATLDELGDSYRPHASELAFRYCALAQGTDAIKRSIAGFNLAGASLRHLTLAGEPGLPLLNLSGCRLVGADLRDAHLQRVRLDDADLQGARLDRAELHECSLHRTQLDGADLSATIMRDSRLPGVDLTNTTTNRTRVLRCDTAGARLGSSFGGVFASRGAGIEGPDRRHRAGNAPTTVGPFPPTGHTGPVRGVAYSPDGTRLATASADGTVRIWDGTTGETLHILTGHTNAVRGVAYSPDGTRLATTSADGTARIWDATTGEHLWCHYHLGTKASATFTALGDLVSASGDAWRHLGLLQVGPDGQVVRVPAEIFGPIPGIGPGPFADAARVT